MTAVLVALAALQAVPFSAAWAQSNAPAPVNSDTGFDSAFSDFRPITADPVSLDQSATPPEGAPLDPPSAAATRVIQWVMASHDNGDLPFVVIDKEAAELLAFDSAGQPLGQGAVLVGITKGDDSAPGVGDRDLQDIPVAERTTPAGRFLATFGPAAGHKEQVIWVDFPDAISLHPVVTTKPKERRLARLKSPTPTDNRISFGCINVDKEFYGKVIDPLFRPDGAIVYILPETRSLHEVFAGISPDDPAAPPGFDKLFADFRLVAAESAPLVASQ